MLVAIAIPIFTTQLERSRESTDLSNIRSAYAEAMTEYLATNTAASATASIRQQDATWHIDHNLVTRVDGCESTITVPNAVVSGSATVTVSTDTTTGKATVSIAMN